MNYVQALYWIAVIVIAIPGILEFFVFSSFIKHLKQPRLKHKHICTLSTPQHVERLAHSYSSMNPLKRKLLKLWLETQDYNNTTLIQIIDLFQKTVLATAFAGSTIAITITVANLTFVKSNYPSWSNMVSDLFTVLQLGMDSFSKIFLLVTVAFCSLSIIISKRGAKDNIRSKHLKIIASVEEELDKITPLS
ncbi:hypothetical protein L2089_15985 [Paenibacillus hunanensis]|uniref:hypothetical protein n=1 Tax=Paenibacillus hunanensis TaxID=539262 RepID=UPI002027677A|nr:hypothetical protein [Paenibacillus hunanensis]MCL9662195.1 hypothetical protein [Paenibacillus hunanensis]